MWESSDGEAKAMMDFILLVNEMWWSSVSMCRAFSKPD